MWHWPVNNTAASENRCPCILGCFLWIWNKARNNIRVTRGWIWHHGGRGHKILWNMRVKFPTLQMDTWHVLWYPHGKGGLGPVHRSWGIGRNAESGAKQKLGLAAWQWASVRLSSYPFITAHHPPTLWSNIQQQEGPSDEFSKPWVLTSLLVGLDCWPCNADSLESWICNVGSQLASWLVSGNHMK